MSVKGPTPICPECGSVAVDRTPENTSKLGTLGCRCKRCGEEGTHLEFTKHIGFATDDPDRIQPTEGRRHVPHLSDEWLGDDQ